MRPRHGACGTADPRATYGDSARLVATFDIAGDTYPGGVGPGGLPARGRLGAGHPHAGGVVLNQDIHGGAPLGSGISPRERADDRLRGVGRVWRNGELLTDSAIIHAAALAWGPTRTMTPSGCCPWPVRATPSWDVLVWNLPRGLEPRGFIQFNFEDVAINVAGTDGARGGGGGVHGRGVTWVLLRRALRCR